MIGFRLIQYKMLADRILMSFDYNDIKEGIKKLKEEYAKDEAKSAEECLTKIDNYFKKLLAWLNEHGKRV